jgi:hypothetical protein
MRAPTTVGIHHALAWEQCGCVLGMLKSPKLTSGEWFYHDAYMGTCTCRYRPNDYTLVLGNEKVLMCVLFISLIASNFPFCT